MSSESFSSEDILLDLKNVKFNYTKLNMYNKVYYCCTVRAP